MHPLRCIVLTLSLLQSVLGAWEDKGAGCCSGDRSALSGSIWKGMMPTLDACKAKCITFANCGYIEYGWKGSGFCFIWSSVQQCTTLATGPTDCGSAGNTGVHTYKYTADAISGKCVDITGFWTVVGDATSTAETSNAVTQSGCDVTAINDGFSWSPAHGTVVGNIVSMFSLTGTYDSNKIAWSNGASWLRDPAVCAAVCAPGSCANNKCQCAAEHRSGLTCQYKGLCRFSPSYDWSKLLTDPAEQDSYVSKMLRWDGHFAVPGKGVLKTSYLTADHVMVGADGEPGAVGAYSAASKESLHISMLAVIVSKAKNAYNWIGADDPDSGAIQAKERLAAIMGAYEKLNADNPGFGGFLPWCTTTPGGFWINTNKNVAIPALDNGQLAWAMVAAAEALQAAGFSAVAARYTAHVDLMRSTAPALFLDPLTGRVFMNSNIKDGTAMPGADNRAGSGFLVDPYEGELMLMFLDLMCAWPDPSRKEFMWAPVKINQFPMEYNEPGLPNGPITVQRGWRFSAHELWKYMILPYTDNALVAQVLANGEKARTWNSKLKKIPGLMGSCYCWNGQYKDTYGIRSISMGYVEPLPDEMMVTAYGAMPLMIANRGYGLAWHRAMMGRPEAQTMMGSIEASQAFGYKVASKVSWDTKVTADLAALGGTVALTRSVINADKTRAARFTEILNYQHSRYKDALKGTDTPFAPPPGLAETDNFPSPAPDFPNCVRTPTKSAAPLEAAKVPTPAPASAVAPAPGVAPAATAAPGAAPGAASGISKAQQDMKSSFFGRWEAINKTKSHVLSSPRLSTSRAASAPREGDKWKAWQLVLVSLAFCCCSFGCSLAIAKLLMKGKKPAFLSAWARQFAPDPASVSYTSLPLQHQLQVDAGDCDAAGARE